MGRRPPSGQASDQDASNSDPLLDARQHAACGHVIEWSGKPIKRIHRAFARVAEAAGLSWCIPHVLKHTAISNLLSLGFTTTQVSIFTETTEELVREVYRHVHGIELDMMAAALGGFGNSVPETEPDTERGARDISLTPQSFMLVGERGFEPPAPTSRT